MDPVFLCNPLPSCLLCRDPLFWKHPPVTLRWGLPSPEQQVFTCHLRTQQCSEGHQETDRVTYVGVIFLYVRHLYYQAIGIYCLNEAS